MLSTDKRIQLLVRLGQYIISDDTAWQQAQAAAIQANPWFTPGHITLAATNIAQQFLQEDKLKNWVASYTLPQEPKTVGIVMAGNIPMVGFHDLLCGFMTGHKLMLKLSSKDEVLMRHIVGKLAEWEPDVAAQVQAADRINGCDAYIATGSNNSARYFEQYFAKYPHIIRRNRTSVAVLDGTETAEELKLLADDVFSYFGLGCRNVTQVCLPEGYDITKLMEAFSLYEDLIHHNKYKNNYDYYLAIYLLNKIPYHTNGSLLMIENNLPFSAVSILHYRYYSDRQALVHELSKSDDIQTVIGHGLTPFGAAQCPGLSDYADGVDVMQFLCSL